MNEQARLLRRVAERGDALREQRDAAGIAYRRLFVAPDRAPAKAPRSTRALVLSLAATLAIAALVVVTVLGTRRPHEDALSFVVGGQPGATMTWIDGHDTVTPIRFSDGTAVLLQPGARARIDAATARGAEVSLEDGRAMVSVVPKRDAHWLFHAGDYDVRVTGTVFELAWSREDKTLFVQMLEGSVVVSGPDLPSPRVLVTGDSVTIGGRQSVSLPPSPSSVESPAPDAPVASATGALASVPHASSALRASAAPSPSASASPRPSYREAAEKGELARAFELLEPSFDEEIAKSDAAGLMEIGRICRLSGQADRAATAYLAVRERHPGTSQAANAAFDLGGLRFARRPGEAETWFRTFLSEAPSSPLGSAARGRLLELAVARHGSDAKSVAEDYLAHHPDGAHAELARATLAGTTKP